MKRIFLDTNILIDYIDNRAGADDAEQIFACGFSGEAQLFASSLTFANMAYIIKSRTQEEKYDALRQMAGVVGILSDIPHFTSSAFVEQLDELIQ